MPVGSRTKEFGPIGQLAVAKSSEFGRWEAATNPVKEDIVGKRQRIDHIHRTMRNAQGTIPSHKFLSSAGVVRKKAIWDIDWAVVAIAAPSPMTFPCKAAAAGTTLKVEPGG